MTPAHRGRAGPEPAFLSAARPANSSEEVPAVALQDAQLLERLAALGDQPGDEDDLRVRKHAFVLTAATVVAAATVWALVGLISGRELLWVSSAIFIVAVLAVLGEFARSKRFLPVVQVLLAIGLAYVVAGHAALGGLSAGGGSLVWGLLAPILAVLLFDVGGGARWFVAYAGMIIGAVLLEPLIAGVAPQPIGIPPVLLFAYNLLGPGLIILFLVRYVDGQRAVARRAYRDLLLQVLPPVIAERLYRHERLIAEHYDSVTVLFADLVNFTPFVERAKPEDVLLVLNDLFSSFDLLADRHGVEKVKTIGDAYMAVAGAPVRREGHADAVFALALDLQREVTRRATLRSRGLILRIGIATGPATGGVIGRRKFAWDLWGDTVNVASRMESTAEPGTIQVTEGTIRALSGSYPFERRVVDVRGKGEMVTYLLDPAASGAADPSPRKVLADEVPEHLEAPTVSVAPTLAGAVALAAAD
jgi:guanylate cyclase